MLGSINLSEFVNDKGIFDFKDFRKTVNIAVKALNEVLDEGLPLHPLLEQRESVRDWRQIGLGIFGLADMLIKMGIKYGSFESVELCDMIGFNMADESIKTSAEIAMFKGTYPKYKECVLESEFFKRNTSESTQELVKEYGLHNSQLLTIAPTGSLSSMFGVSGGIEPIFANYYTRKTESLHGDDVFYKVYTPIVQEYMDKHGLADDSELPNYFVTAQTLNHKDRVSMQSIWQSHIDASISSTVNLPKETTVEEVEAIYMHAWEKGLKGITIFREGCARLGVLTTEAESKESNAANSSDIPRGEVLKVSDNAIGKKRKLMTGCGSLHCSAFFDPNTGDLLETFLSKGSTGGCNNYMNGLSRMMSLAARGGVSIDDIVNQLDSCGACPSYAIRSATKKDTSKGACCPMAVGNALKDMHKEMMHELENKTHHSCNCKKEDDDKKDILNPCPECGDELRFEGGCNICKSCGYSKCD